LHPYDLLKLARLKDFRQTLMNRSAITVWKKSFQYVEGLPAPPEGMSEPAWANLAFDPHCHVCHSYSLRISFEHKMLDLFFSAYKNRPMDMAHAYLQ
jgi:hypothetical protein